MDLKALRRVLSKMGRDVVARSRQNLIRSGIKKGKLYNSLDSKVTKTPKGLSLGFYMEVYGMFIDAGVWGSDPKEADAYEREYSKEEKKVIKTDKLKYEGKQKGRQTNSVFTSGAGKVKAQFRYKDRKPPMNALKEYIKDNNLRFRNPKGTSTGGQYRAGGQEAMAYWMQNRIWAQGITPTLFFTNAFKPAYYGLTKEIANLFDLQVKALFKDAPINKK
jgi:hypothetical protein